MARPQLEDGHTQIANEILERLMAVHLSPNQWQVLLCIIRKTYGFHKKVDYIANFQIAEATNLCKAVVSRALHTLEDMNIIVRRGKSIGFQKDWEQWQKLAEQSTKVSRIVNKQKLAISSTLATELAEQSTPEKLAISSTELAEQSTKVSSPAVTQKIKDTKQKKQYIYKRYGEFNNVLLTDEECQKLKDKFNHRAAEVIEELSSGIESHGYKYRSHYAAILSWQRRNQKGGEYGKDSRHIKSVPGNRPAGAFADLEERDENL